MSDRECPILTRIDVLYYLIIDLPIQQMKYLSAAVTAVNYRLGRSQNL